MGMAEDVLDDLRKRINKTLDDLRRELAKVRTGRANPALLEGVRGGRDLRGIRPVQGFDMVQDIAQLVTIA